MSLTSTQAQFNSLPVRSPTLSTIPLDMANYQSLPFDRDAVSTSTSLSKYGLGPNEFGLGKGNDPYSLARPAPSTLSSQQSHSFIQTPYQASLTHPAAVQAQGQWPETSVSSVELARMGVPMPALGSEETASVRQGKRRALPPLPSGVPVQPPPAWEPDTKAHIPASLIQPSIEHAYTSLSGPGPSRPAASSTSMATPTQPQTQQPPALDPRRPAEHGVNLSATGITPIWSTHYLDPALDDACVLLAPQPPTVKRKRRNSNVPVPIAGVWEVPPDGRFVAEDGAVDLTLGVVDSKRGPEGGLPGERTRAKMEIVARAGEVKIDLLDIAPTRQVDLNINTKTGDILILLPRSFHGPLSTLHGTSNPPTYLPALRSSLSNIQSTNGRSVAFLNSSTYIPPTRPQLGQRRYSQRLASTQGESHLYASSVKGRVVIGIHGEDEKSLERWTGVGGSGVQKGQTQPKRRRGLGRLFGGGR